MKGSSVPVPHPFIPPLGSALVSLCSSPSLFHNPPCRTPPPSSTAFCLYTSSSLRPCICIPPLLSCHLPILLFYSFIYYLLPFLQSCPSFRSFILQSISLLRSQVFLPRFHFSIHPQFHLSVPVPHVLSLSICFLSLHFSSSTPFISSVSIHLVSPLIHLSTHAIFYLIIRS